MTLFRFSPHNISFNLWERLHVLPNVSKSYMDMPVSTTYAQLVRELKCIYYEMLK